MGIDGMCVYIICIKCKLFVCYLKQRFQVLVDYQFPVDPLFFGLHLLPVLFNKTQDTQKFKAWCQKVWWWSGGLCTAYNYFCFDDDVVYYSVFFNNKFGFYE